MVWFQCEDCGDNLKKPKLPNHFRSCSASRLSCIDCGEVFGRQSVETHTQCITEAEKYGPKGQVKAPNGAKPKATNDSNQKPDFDTNVGLSERPPWFCSLCNTNATSKQTLQLHAEGKKHRAKARAFHAANQPPKQIEETEKDSVVDKEKNEISVNGHVKPNTSEPECVTSHASVEATNGDLKSSKKRKSEPAEKDDRGAKHSVEMCTELGTGEVVQLEKPDTGKETRKVKKAKHSVIENHKENDLNMEKEGKKKIKWKKLITSVLKSNPDGKLKFKKLKTNFLKLLNEADYKEDESQIISTLEKKINSSSKFTVDGKYVTLAKRSDKLTRSARLPPKELPLHKSPCEPTHLFPA